jgi:hypothetical protein
LSEIWVGRTEVTKAEGCELDFHGAGAFVWWATQASSEIEFSRKLGEAINHYKLVLLELSHVRQFSESDEVSDDFFEMVEGARECETWVLFGTFNTYPRHDA